MTMSNFPGGFKNGVSIRGVPLVQTHPGKVFWVSNSTVRLPNQKAGSNGNDGSFNAPFSTLQGAIDACVTARGDVIFVKPGHAENITTAGSTVNINKAGVAIIGLGSGSYRPTFTFTTANTVYVNLAAANVTLQNLVFEAGFLDVAKAINVSNAQVARDFTVENCEFRDGSAILTFVKIISVGTTANIASGLTFVGNKVFGMASTPGAGSTVITLASDSQRVNISDNVVVHNVALNDTPILFEGGALNHTWLTIARNKCSRPNASCASSGHLIGSSSTACSGHVYDNYVKTLDVAAMLIAPTGTKLGFTNNLLSGTADTSGVVIPAADSDGS
jgi:hypothetical protein